MEPERAYVTAEEAAAMLGIKPDSVRDLIHRGRLAAQQFGRFWLILVEDVRIREQQAHQRELLRRRQIRAKRRARRDWG